MKGRDPRAPARLAGRLAEAPTGLPAPAAARLPAIDQMRGVAILLVLIYHAGPLAWRVPPYQPSGWLAWPSLGAAWLLVPLLHFGFSGVHAFFVLSGFCIHFRAARERAHDRAARIRLRPFFLRRFWRIYPPYWIALALFGVIVPLGARLLAPPTPLPSVRDLLLHAAMLHTLDAKTIFSINPAFWSLATEEQFYLAYPLLLLALGRFGLGRVLAAALGLSLVWRAALLAVVPPTVEHFMAYRVLLHAFFLPRWFEWILGCALAEWVASPSRKAALRPARLAVAGGLLLLLAMACRIHVVVDKLLSDALFAAGFAALTGAALIAPATRRSGLRVVVGGGLSSLGRRAYGLYLVHQPLVDGLALPVIARLAAALSAGLAFSRWFERPFEARSKRVGAGAASSAPPASIAAG